MNIFLCVRAKQYTTFSFKEDEKLENKNREDYS